MLQPKQFLIELQKQEIYLWLEGGQLAFDAPEEAFTDEIREQIVAQKAAIVRYLRDFATDDVQPITPTPRTGDPSSLGTSLPLSFAQQRLWFLNQLDPDSAFYNMPTLIRLTGKLDVAALEQSFKYLIARHESLRTAFVVGADENENQAGEPVQMITPPNEAAGQFALAAELVSSEQAAQEEAQRAIRTPFNLSKGSMLRVRLFQLSTSDHLLLINIHHIIGDGWSIGVLIDELMQAYSAYTQGKRPDLPELPIQYADFAVWQREQLSGERLAQEITFWRDRLSGAPALLELPTDRPRPPIQSHRGGQVEFQLSPELSARLNQLAQQHDATLYMILLAGYSVLLSRYSRQDDIVVGTSFTNRNRAEIDGLIGIFVNTIVQRTQLDGNPSFVSVLEQVRGNTLAAYEHPDTPFEQLVDELGLERTLSYNPLYQVMMDLQSVTSSEIALPSLKGEMQASDFPFAKFDLSLFWMESETGLLGLFEYATDLFDAATIERMASHLTVLLEGAVAQPELPVSQLPLLTAAEKQQILYDWNDTAVNFGEPQPIHALFEQHAAAEGTPNATALVFDDATLTYAALNARANQLAHYLIALGVEADMLVAVSMERSAEMVVALLAILKAGGAYVPVDPTYPSERIRYMLDDCGASILLTQSHLILHLSVAAEQIQHVVYVDKMAEQLLTQSVENPLVDVSAENLIYVIYTSGSTGYPKGVAIEHRNVFNYLHWCLAQYGVEQGNGSLFHSPLSFDLTVTTIWSPLLCGNAIHLLPNATIGATIDAIADRWRVNRHDHLSFVKLTPAHLQLINHELKPEQFSGRVGALIIGGEALHQSIVEPWLEHAPETKLVNEYGPTEATVGCVTYTATATDTSKWVKIGKPIANTQVYILNEQQIPLPVGVAGELYIGGSQLARGYLKRPNLTAERFIEHAEFGRLYKTGDLCRWLPDGSIEFIGRTDFQVKVRGFRIELGEIENTLLGQEGVRETVVLAREDDAGDKQLVAYVVGDAQPATLRDQLAQRLPEYMVPATFVMLDRLPLTPNGKVDRSALPEPQPTVAPPVTETSVNACAATEGSTGSSELETQVAEIWRKVLKVETVRAEDNFFKLGGHSLLATLTIARMRKQLALDVPIKTFFDAKNLADLVQTISPPPVEETANPLTEPVAEIWRKVLKVETVRAEDNFFKLGGHSLLATLTIARMRKQLALDVPLKTFFDAKNLADFVQAVTPTPETAPPPNPLEAQVAEIWRKTLRVEAVEPQDNFFKLGGHSLLAAVVIARMRKQLNIEVPLKTFFDASNLADFVSKVSPESTASEPDAIEPLTRNAQDTTSFPLSFAQQRLWFLDRLEPNSPFYNIPVMIRLTGNLDVVVLEQSFDYLIRRHESLRTTFALVDGEPQQMVHPPTAFKLEVVRVANAAEAQQIGQNQALAPFDLSQRPLMRVQLLRIAPTDHLLVLAMHHIISDGWSMGVLVEELSAAYHTYLQGNAPTLPDLPIQYADFAVWQRDYLSGERLNKQLTYWRDQLKGAPALLELPTDRPRPPVQSHRGAHYEFQLDAELTTQLNQLAQSHDATLFMVLLSAFNVLLARYSRQNDIVIGSPIANRNRTEIEGLLGVFINTLVLRTQLTDNLTFTSLLKQVKQTALAAYDHQDLPFEQLVDELELERTLAYSPLFQVLLVLDNNEIGEFALPNLTATAQPADYPVAKFDLSLYLREVDGDMAGVFEYTTDLFDLTTIERMVSHFKTLLDSIVAEPEQQVMQLPLLPTPEYEQIVHTWNGTAVDFGVPQTLQTLFEQQVARTPHAVALVGETLGRNTATLTYSELNARANQLAHHLITLGVQPDTLVAVAMERSVEMVVSLLAVLKAGGAYIPIDPTYPAQRIQFMLSDSNAPILLTQSHLPQAQQGQYVQHVIPVDAIEARLAGQSIENPQTETGTDHLAYMIYTSGSTGQPKGVTIPHKNLFNLLQDNIRRFELSPASCVMHAPTFGFDVGVGDLFMALCSGAKLYMPSPEKLVGHVLRDQLRQSQATHVSLTPTALSTLPVEPYPHLEMMILAGEALPDALTQSWLPFTPVWNAYGPTENTIYTTAVACRVGEKVTIGKPTANVCCYVLDEGLNPTPIGVPGELHIGGNQLAYGYLNRPNLTSERFIEHPQFGRLYKTGDLCRWLPNAEIEYIGRTDFQVKIRGFRIELGEIENALREQDGIREAVVVARTLGNSAVDKQLVAYVVGNADNRTTLRSKLRERLPDYMIPAAIVTLPAMPLNPNGKLDRRALPDPEPIVSSAPFVPPTNAAEETIVNVWREVLERETVSIHDNFFDVGGHSLLVIQVHTRLQPLYPQLKVVDLFTYSTVHTLATYLQQAKQSATQQNGEADPSNGQTRIAQRRARQLALKRKRKRTTS